MREGDRSYIFIYRVGGQCRILIRDRSGEFLINELEQLRPFKSGFALANVMNKRIIISGG